MFRSACDVSETADNKNLKQAEMQQGTYIASANKVYRGKPAKQTVQPNLGLPMVVAVRTDISGGTIDDLPDKPLQLTPDSSSKLHDSIAARHTACVIFSINLSTKWKLHAHGDAVVTNAQLRTYFTSAKTPLLQGQTASMRCAGLYVCAPVDARNV